MKTIFGGDVNEAVHQEDADEVTHLFPAWVRGAKGLPYLLATVFHSLDTCRALQEKMYNITSVIYPTMSLEYMLMYDTVQ